MRVGFGLSVSKPSRRFDQREQRLADIAAALAKDSPNHHRELGAICERAQHIEPRSERVERSIAALAECRRERDCVHVERARRAQPLRLVGVGHGALEAGLAATDFCATSSALRSGARAKREAHDGDSSTAHGSTRG
jgi:hypothetical protein